MLTPLHQVTILMATSIILLIVQIIYILPAWQKKVVQAFLIIMYGNLVWIGGYLMELNAGSVKTMLFWSDFEFLGQPFIFYGLLLFVMHLTRTAQKWVRLSSLIALIPPLLINLMVWIPGLYPLMRVAPTLNTGGPFNTLNQSYGVAMYTIYYPYIYTCFVFCLLLITNQWKQLGSIFIRQARGVIAAIAILMLSDLLYILGVNLYPGFNHTSVIMVPVSLLTLSYIQRHFLMNIIPVAKSEIFEELDVGLIITDPQLRILDVNPKAAQWFPALRTVREGHSFSMLNTLPELQKWVTSDQDFLFIKLPGKIDILARRKNLYDTLQQEILGKIILFTNISELDELTRKTGVLTRLFDDTLSMQEEIASEIASELHDDLLSSLTMLYQGLDKPLREIPQITQMYSRTVQKIRGVISELYNFTPELGLYASLQMLVDDLNTSDQQQFFLSIPDSEKRYPLDVETHIYRIVQQACRNAQMHSQAENIILDGTLESEKLSILIADDGIGFAAESEVQNVAKGRHFGISNMTARSNLIGAAFEITSAPGQGTEVSLQWEVATGEGNQPQRL